MIEPMTKMGEHPVTLTLDKSNPLATKVQTRDGRKARLICADGKSGFGDFPLVVLVANEDGHETLYAANTDGKCINVAAQTRDLLVTLINVPVPPVEHRRWVNVYREANGYVWFGKEEPRKCDADARAERNTPSEWSRIACVEVVFREGDRL